MGQCEIMDDFVNDLHGARRKARGLAAPGRGRGRGKGRAIPKGKAMPRKIPPTGDLASMHLHVPLGCRVREDSYNNRYQVFYRGSHQSRSWPIRGSRPAMQQVLRIEPLGRGSARRW